MNRRLLLRSTALLALSLPQTGCRVLLRQLRPSRKGARGGTTKGVVPYQIMVDGYQRTGLVHVPVTAQ